MARVAEVVIRIKGQDELSGPLKNIANQFKSLNGLFGGVGKGLGGISGTLLNVANSLYIAETAVKAVNFAFDAAVGTVRLFTDEIVKSVQAASEFEYAMVAVTSKSDALGDSLKSADLEKTAIDLAKLSKFSPTEVAAGMEKLAMSGFNTAQIMGAMPGVIALATAANTDLATSGDIATNIMMAFGVAAEDMMASADTMTAALINSNMSIMDLQQGMKFIGPAANRMGMSIGDAAAALGVLNNVGLKAGIAGRGLRSAFTSLFDPSKKAAGWMEKLGISVDDGSGNLKNMTTLLEDFKKALAGMSEVETTEALNAIFTTEGATAFSAILDNMDEYYKLLGKVGDASGLAQKIQEEYLNTIQGRWEQLQETLYGIRVQIGGKFNPVLKEMIVTFQSFLDRNTDRIVKFFTVFADLLRETWGFAQNVTDAFKRGGIDAGFKELRKGLGSFATQLEKIGRDWKTWWSKISGSAQFQALKKDIIDGLKGIGIAILAKLGEWGAIFWQWIDKKVAPETPGVFRSLGKVIIDAIGSMISSIYQKLSELVQGFWDWVSGVKSDSGSKINGLMQSIATAISQNWDIVLAVLGKLLFGWWGFFVGLILPGVGPNLGKIITNIAEYFRQNWPKIEETLTEWGTNFWNWLTNSVLPAAQTEFNQLSNEISRIIGEIWPVIEKKLTEWSSAFWGWLDIAIAEAPTRVTELVQSIGDALNGSVLDANTAFGAWLTDFWRKLIPLSFDVSADMVRFTDAITAWATSEETGKAFSQVGEGLAKNIVVGLNSLMMSGGALEAIGGAITSSLLMSGQNIKETVWSIGAAIAAGMVIGFVESLTGGEFSDKAANEMVWRFQEMAKSVLEAMAPVPVLILEGVEALIKLIAKLDELQRKIAELGFAGIFGEDYDQKLSQGFDNLIDTLGLENGLTKLKEGFDSLNLPWWLTPGSPTPLETGLKGINEALINMPSIPNAFPPIATEQAMSLHQAITSVGQTLINSVTPALDQVTARVRVLWGLFNQLRAITLQWGAALNSLTKTINNVAAAMDRLNTTMERFSTPDTLTPGSPTPFEMGLRGIADAISSMPSLQLAGAPVGTGGGTTNYYITVGSVSATSSGTQNSDDEAILMTVNLLRQALGRG